MSEKIRLIIDTDPGQDDAAAILMAHGLAKRGLIDFMALTVVAAFAAGMYTERFLAQDACLDQGGVYQHNNCRTEPPQP